ncbi:MAG TPA: tannase/feruloyl esterase family alpha/beta hydrolase, partial [Candidatus Polarisedimenticolia bacterium]|nr:tannase/feruloyl esterase family alpha/beta hydrolase [Candidatus Polarisedimenticolia bacterium]
VNRRIPLCICLALIVAAFLPVTTSGQTSCEGLAKLTLTRATITSAASVAAGSYKPPAAPGLAAPTKELPAFCRVAGIAKPTSDSEIHFEVWLPASGWNGKFEQVGNGGFAGMIPLSAMAEPLLHGYAAAATDDGHVSGPDQTWAIGHPERVADFGYRAVHETSVQAKAILRAFYGKDARRNYFVGCSEGGREGLTEAQRYPKDFEGIVAGAPAIHWDALQLRGAWDALALLETPASYIPPVKLPVLQNAAIAACDAMDGAKDGFIENPELCRFHPAVVECKGGDPSNCLTAAQVQAAEKIYGPMKNSRTGAVIGPGFSPGVEAFPANWPVWITGRSAPQLGIGKLFAVFFFRDLVFEDPKWDVQSLNLERDIEQADRKFGALLNSDNPNLRAFKASGGKLIQYHGWGDAAIPPQGSVDYFRSVQKAMGNTKSFYRLFMVPTMSHCAGGPGATIFGNAGGLEPPQQDADHDVVLALDRWVEKGVAPDRIIATGFVDNSPAKGVAMTHPLCPYPQVARYKGTGDTKDAANFACEAPRAKRKK